MKRSFFFFLLTSILLQSCLSIETPYTMIAPGLWRAQLDLRDPDDIPPHPDHTGPETEFDFSPTPEGVLPFHFEVEYQNPDSMTFTLINGEERIPVRRYQFTPNVEGEKGEIILYFPIYDTRIVAKVQAGVMEGYWYVDHRKNYRIPFKARLGEKYRFTNSPKTPDDDISGSWATTFSTGTEDEYPAIGEFRQSENQLTGTFLTETGDYRYLEGTVSGEDIFLSSFDGATAYLFEAKIVNPDQIMGVFYSGTHFHTTWEARRNGESLLKNPDQITMPAQSDPIQFAGESITGDQVDFDQPPYLNKVKIIEIMGSWCPNCHDATQFLKSWKKDHADLPVEIISLAFERYEDREKSLEVLNKYREENEIPWPVIYGGPLSKVNESAYTQFVDGIKAYPTFIIVDAQNKIQYIHTGISGPATSAYESFKTKMNQVIQETIRQAES